MGNGHANLAECVVCNRNVSPEEKKLQDQINALRAKREKIRQRDISKWLEKQPHFEAYVDGGIDVYYRPVQNKTFVVNVLKQAKKSMTAEEVAEEGKKYGRNSYSIRKMFYGLRKIGIIRKKNGTGENIYCYVK